VLDYFLSTFHKDGLIMSFPIDEFISQDPDFRELLSGMKKEGSLSAVILASLTIGLTVARSIASEILTQRGQAEGNRPLCPKCGRLLESKGMLPRSIISIIGTI